MKYFNIKKLLKHQEVHIPLFDIRRQQMKFYYSKFIELECILSHMDSMVNSEEYMKVYRLAFSYLDKYIDLYKKGHTDFKFRKEL